MVDSADLGEIWSDSDFRPGCILPEVVVIEKAGERETAVSLRLIGIDDGVVLILERKDVGF